ncbi:MAG: hypothetical protein GY803_07130 [Chloroflexi bacterium]|nr:hypothetical protein [Chloroflexota bacterium]
MNSAAIGVNVHLRDAAVFELGNKFIIGKNCNGNELICPGNPHEIALAAKRG